VSKKPESRPPAVAAPRAAVKGSLAAVLLIGAAIRLACALSAPLSSYAPDHRDNMAWSAYAFENGPTKLYDMPEGWPIVSRMVRNGVEGQDVVFAPHRCNYPPLSALVFWFQGAVWAAVDRDVVQQKLRPQAAVRIGRDVISSRVIETRTARLVQALPSVLADVALALGVVALVRAARAAGRGWALRDVAVFGLAWLAPPVFLDSAYWNQTDSWIASWMVWSLWAAHRERWLLTGLLVGLAIVTKPQAILLGPVLGYVFLSCWLMPGGRAAAALRMAWKTALGAIVGVLLIAGPFMLADAGTPEGPLRWFARSYRETIGAEAYARTTLNALNVWWLHYVAGGATREALASTTAMLGMTRDGVGRLALSAALIASGVLAARRWSWARESWLPLAFLVFLAAFLFPTRVHERYIYYCIPVVMALVFTHGKAWIVPLVGLLIVGTFEMLTFRWLNVREAGPRAWSIVLALLAVGCFVYSLVVLLATAREYRVSSRE
jgi:hypothetical protein